MSLYYYESGVLIRVSPSAVAPASFGEDPRAKITERVDGGSHSMAAAPLFEEGVEIIYVLAVLSALGPCGAEGCQARHVPRQTPQPGTAAHEAQDPRRRKSLAMIEICG